MTRSRRALLATCAATFGLAGCLSDPEEEITISKVYASNWLQEPRRVIIRLERDDSFVIDGEFTIPPAESPNLGHLPIEIDWPNTPAEYSIEAYYPEDTDYDGDRGGTSVDPIPGGENDCTYLNVHVNAVGDLGLYTGNHGCDGGDATALDPLASRSE